MTGRTYYQFLLERYVDEEATEAEIAELFEELKKSKDDEAWAEMIEAITAKGKADAGYDRVRWEKVIRNIIASDDKNELRIRDREQGNGDTESGNFSKLSETRRIRHVLRYVAAACIIGFMIWSVVFWIGRPFEKVHDEGGEAAQTKVQDVEAPYRTKAVIILADGTRMHLDSVGKGVIALEGGVEVEKLADGQILYNQESNKNNQGIIYNSLINPRGSKVINIMLSDGSRVWLNAGSSIRYPVVFTGKERKVTIGGEAYFNIAHDKSKPFIVSSGKMDVRVLGTQFNVNAYEDEKEMKVTLLEGSVMTSIFDSQKQVRSSLILKPGQQAIIGTDIYMADDVDTDAVVAWMNGLFSFDNADLSTVMRELSRWYDLDVRYHGGVPKGRFKGEISKDLTLGQILSGLSETRINYKLEGGKKITILSE